MLRVVTAMWIAVALWTSARNVLAAPENVTYSLGWTRMDGAEKCIGAAGLARAVEARLGHAAWAPTSAADIQIEGHVEKRADRPGWRARIVLTDPKGAVLGQREIAIDEPACEALEEPLVLMLALIIDPQLILCAIRPPHPFPRHASNPAHPSRRPSLAHLRPPRLLPRSVHRGEVEGGVAFAAGLLPGLATGLTVSDAFWPGTWSLEVGGTLWFPSGTDVDAVRGATFSLVEASGRACPVAYRDSRFLLRPCAGGSGGVVVVQGVGFDEPRSQCGRRPSLRCRERPRFASSDRRGSGFGWWVPSPSCARRSSTKPATARIIRYFR